MAYPSYDHLLGKKFLHGTVDCYSLVRDFYRDCLGIPLQNYARPDDWWDSGMNLYVENFRSEGFRVLDCHPSEIQFGDLALCAVRSSVPNHAAIFVEAGDVIHHLPGGLSCRERYRALLRNTTCMILRHKAVVLPQPSEPIDVREYLPISVQREIAAAEALAATSASGGGGEGAGRPDPA